MRYLIVLLLLGGCYAPGKTYWEQPGKSEQEMRQDLYDCDKATVIERPMYRGTSIDRCMQAKGWR